MTSIPTKDFVQDLRQAYDAVRHGPLFLTEGDLNALVVLSIQEYRRLSGTTLSLAEALADHHPDADFDFDFELTR